ncbi:DUF3192 domain-containing protein [Shewanella sp. KT0246]|uniref:DUF3192 domain-containing protein n=1 Tax=Shewanella sp. KT0246 TaxID=2815912 RepID=UPI001BBFF25F|nr:DUF3192 domain-containing protein [Shewanella sp. KT0246]GIU53428.1 DUF3192 domain-containing protein [Shewanella sp. KT0246]
MKPSLSFLIASMFIAYVVFAITVVLVYEPRPEDRSWQDRQEFNHRMLSEITIGQSITSIRQKMGRADFTEAKATEDANFQIMFYRTHHVKSDGITTKDECTPLLFKDDQLIAWGQETYDQFLQIPILNVVIESSPVVTSKPAASEEKQANKSLQK